MAGHLARMLATRADKRKHRRRRIAWLRRQDVPVDRAAVRSEEHTSELQSLMRISYAVFCLKKKKQTTHNTKTKNTTNTQINSLYQQPDEHTITTHTKRS